MSRDWALIVILAIGHVGWFVLFVNVVHGLGLEERRVNALKLLIVAAALALSAEGVWAIVLGRWSAWPWYVQTYAVLCLAMALVGLPAATLARWLRRSPAGITEQSSLLDLPELHGMNTLSGQGRHSWLLRIPGNESLLLRRRQWEVPVPNLPIEWDGLSILQLSDLHFSPCYRRRYFELVIDEATATGADLALFTGDLVDSDEALDWIVPLLGRVRGRCGTVAIVGNHDKTHHPERIGALLAQAGFTFLDGGWTALSIEGRTLAIGGTAQPWGPAIDFQAAPDADFRLLLSHSPDLFYRAASAGIELMFCGHNHGGQIRLPILGPIFMPSIYSRRFDRGFFRRKETLMHVSQGVGGKHPIRYGCIPEIGRFVLRSTRSRRFAAPGSHRAKSARIG